MRDSGVLDRNVDRVTQLLKLGTSTVYEGSGIDCWIDPQIRPMWRGARVAGPAFTVQGELGDNLAIQRAVREAPRGSVLVVESGGTEFGYWGEMLTEIARIRGLAGLVINGTVRDIDEIEAVRFPVFAVGVAMRHANKKYPGMIGEEILLSGRRVRTSDVIVADTDGVVAIPAKQVDAALEGGRRRADMESDRLEVIRSGQVPPMTTEGGLY